MKREKAITHIGRERLLFGPLKGIGWLSHCFTTRRFYERRRAAGGGGGIARALRAQFFRSARLIAWAEQVHGAAVARVSGASGDYREFAGADALVSSAPGACITTFSADCPIVYIVDLTKRVVALVHSGRRGTEKRVVTACIAEMRRSWKTSPGDCIAVVSPSIGPCCYPVDLRSRIVEQIFDEGIGNIFVSELCTSCRPGLFFSYRREGKGCGRMAAALMIEEPGLGARGETGRAARER